MKGILVLAFGLFLLAIGGEQASATPGWASGNVNCRSGPGTNYSKVYTVPYCAPFEVYGCNYGWCQVSYQGYSCYVSQRYVRYSPCYSGGGGGGYTPYRKGYSY